MGYRVWPNRYGCGYTLFLRGILDCNYFTDRHGVVNAVVVGSV